MFLCSSSFFSWKMRSPILNLHFHFSINEVVAAFIFIKFWISVASRFCVLIFQKTCDRQSFFYFHFSKEVQLGWFRFFNIKFKVDANTSALCISTNSSEGTKSTTFWCLAFIFQNMRSGIAIDLLFAFPKNIRLRFSFTVAFVFTIFFCVCAVIFEMKTYCNRFYFVCPLSWRRRPCKWFSFD